MEIPVNLVSIIRRSLAALEGGSYDPSMAATLFDVFLSLEDLNEWIEARGGWCSGDDHGKRGIRTATARLLKNLSAAIQQDTNSLQISEQEVITLVYNLGEADFGSKNDEALGKLCESIADLQQALSQLRISILAKFKIEDLL